MTALVLLVGPPGSLNGRGPLAGVCAALQDWSALGLLNRFIWVDAETVGLYEVEGVQIDDGMQMSVGVADRLAVGDPDTLEPYEMVRLCVLVPLFSNAQLVPATVEQQVSELLVIQGGGARVELLRALISRPEGGLPTAEFSREGWHNIVCNPEDARGPGLSHKQLPPSTDPIDIAQYAATTLAGLLGLWRGVDEAPLDGQRPLPGGTVRLARSFYRNLDATAVEATTRAGVLSVDDRTPIPTLEGGRVRHAENAAAATAEAAEALWAKHARVLGGARKTIKPIQPGEISWFKALRLLFGFVFAALARAPSRWYQAVLARVESTTARRVHELVYGNVPSAYIVVVNGRRADGQLAGWQDLSAAAQSIEARVDTGQATSEHQLTFDHRAVWKDYVASAFTLMDAGETRGFKPIRVTVERRVLAGPDACVPGADAMFRGIPGHLSVEMGYAEVHPSDPLGSLLVERRLKASATDESVPMDDVERALSDLKTHRQRYENSFSSRVGEVLGGRYLAVANEIRTALQALSQAAQATEISDETWRKQRSLARRILLLLVAFLVGLAILGTAGVLKWLAWSTVGIVAGGLLLGWLITSFLMFFHAQRDLFRLLYLLEQTNENAAIHEQNLRAAIVDLRRLAQAYQEFLLWTRILGVIIARPFGDQPKAGPAAPLPLEGVPLATRLGVAAIDAARIDDAVHELRGRCFRVGWLSQPWESTLADAPQRLGLAAKELRAQPELMFAEPATDDGLLSRWAELLEAEGVGQAGGDQLWRQVMTFLDGDPMARQLVNEVATGGEASVDVVRQPVSRFMARMDSAPARNDDLGFDTVLLRREYAHSFAEIQQSWVRTSKRGLGQVAVLVQLGSGLPDAVLGEGPDDGLPVGKSGDAGAPPSPRRASPQDTSPRAEPEAPPPPAPPGDGVI